MASKMNDLSNLIKTEYGYYTFKELPSVQELEEFYSKKYYQNDLGSYSADYSEEEFKHIELRINLIYAKISKYVDLSSSKKCLDVGCGEGWLLKKFKSERHEAEAIDFSGYAIEKFNKHLVKDFTQGDIFEILKHKKESGEKFQVITLANVIEHVLDPVELLEILKNLLSEDGILMIMAPNDFSELHNHLLENKYIDKEFWISYPGHLSYFNQESMYNLLGSQGLSVVGEMCDNPIDLNLLNDNSNYVKDKAKGLNTHLFRMRMDLFFGDSNFDKMITLYSLLANMGIGRNIQYYVKNESSTSQ